MNKDNIILKDILQKSGWYNGRSIEIEQYKVWLLKYGFKANNIILDSLKSFGGLTFRIPCYRELIRGTNISSEDAYWDVSIDPLYYIDEQCDDEDDINELINYVRNIEHFMDLTIVPIGRAKDSDDYYDLFMAQTGEIIGAYEGTCGILGFGIENTLLSIMTTIGDDFKQFE